MGDGQCNIDDVNGIQHLKVLSLTTPTIGIFFDGTANNMYNVNAGVGYKNDRSYMNDYSNIYKLQQLYKKTSIYIEGAGTEACEDDATYGLAMGKGGTGVYTHVGIACNKLADILEEEVFKKSKKKKKIPVTLDVFGFSRGAASARNFVYQFSQKYYGRFTIHSSTRKKYYNRTEYPSLKREEMENKYEIRIRFLGIFDTVLSIGVPSFEESDVEDFPLNVKNAEYVFHITSMDEYRENFSLTKIGTDVEGREVALPGVHADIGGSYKDNVNEMWYVIDKVETTISTKRNYDEIQKFNEEQKAPLIRKATELVEGGWYDICIEGEWKEEYKNLNILIIKYSITGYAQVKWELVGYRRNISNKYSLIPLSIMHDFALRRNVPLKPLTGQFKVPDELKEAESRLFTHALNMYESDENNSQDYQLLKFLRSKYLHISARYGGDDYDLKSILSKPDKPSTADDGKRRIFKKQQ